jgi:hypothetical protein
MTKWTQKRKMLWEEWRTERRMCKVRVALDLAVDVLGKLSYRRRRRFMLEKKRMKKGDFVKERKGVRDRLVNFDVGKWRWLLWKLDIGCQ